MKANDGKFDMRHLREKANLRTVDVASLIGVGEASVRNWEKGRTEPKLNISQVVQLCKIYECSLEDLEKAAKESMSKINRSSI